MLRGVALAVVVVLSFAPPVSGREAGGGAGITGTITRVDGRNVLVEEEPEERSGSDKSYVEVTEGTEISVRRSGDEVPAAFEDLSVGRRVEVVFEGAVAESYPTQASAGSVVILEGAGELPDTGGDAGGSWLALLIVCLLTYGVWRGIRHRG